MIINVIVLIFVICCGPFTHILFFYIVRNTLCRFFTYIIPFFFSVTYPQLCGQLLLLVLRSSDHCDPTIIIIIICVENRRIIVIQQLLLLLLFIIIVIAVSPLLERTTQIYIYS